jgi:hypothetical protein
MHIEIERNVRPYVDVEGAGLVSDGPAMRDAPAAAFARLRQFIAT